MMKRVKETLGLSFLAGVAIGIGATVYLSCENKIVGSLLFACGLYAICTQGLYLFTGKVGYALSNDKSYLVDLGWIWLGNLLGTGFVSLVLSFTRIFANVQGKAQTLCEVKFTDNMMSLFCLGIMCGLLMYIAVDGYKKTTNPVILFVPVSVFILCGFEHCIADMAYFWLAGCVNLQGLLILLVITLGNSVGGILIPAVVGLSKTEK